MEALIALNHPPAAVLKYTPRQMWAYLWVAQRRQTREEKRLLRLHAMAARGDLKQIKKEIREGGEDGG